MPPGCCGKTSHDEIPTKIHQDMPLEASVGPAKSNRGPVRPLSSLRGPTLVGSVWPKLISTVGPTMHSFLFFSFGPFINSHYSHGNVSDVLRGFSPKKSFFAARLRKPYTILIVLFLGFIFFWRLFNSRASLRGMLPSERFFQFLQELVVLLSVFVPANSSQPY